MYLVGLTGGIGSGKSTVAARCAARGWPVLDADQLAREVVEPGEATVGELAERFGAEVVGGDGTLDRAELARRAFGDAESKAALDAITHPRIAQRLRDRVVALRDAAEPPTVAVLDHPLLLETGTSEWVDTVVVVLADVEVRVGRLVAQRGLGEADVRARIRAQTDDTQRRAGADHVVVNDTDLEGLHAVVDPLLDALERTARTTGGRAVAAW